MHLQNFIYFNNRLAIFKHFGSAIQFLIFYKLAFQKKLFLCEKNYISELLKIEIIVKNLIYAIILEKYI